MTNHMDHLARRVRDDPFFLASLLTLYARSEGLDEAGLARRLGIEVNMLSPLALCRAPYPEPPEVFHRDVEAIASRFGIDSARLTEMVRRGQVLQKIGVSHSESNTLMAARDREDPEEES